MSRHRQHETACLRSVDAFNESAQQDRSALIEERDKMAAEILVFDGIERVLSVDLQISI